MIRTSTHTLKFANRAKMERYLAFHADYVSALQFYVDHLFEKYKDDYSKIPKYIEDGKNIKPEGLDLSARSLQNASKQAIGIIRGLFEKNKRRNYINETKGKDIALAAVSRPVVSRNAGMELNSNVCDFVLTPCGSFDGYIQLKSYAATRGQKIRIPIKFHGHSNKVSAGSELKSSFLMKRDGIDFRWEREDVATRTDGKTVGLDQGINSIVTVSDGQQPKADIHGWTYKSVLVKLSRKKFGSKAFKRAKAHQKNHINWSINQLNLQGIKELRIEKLWDMGRGKKTSRLLKHFNYPAINAKIESSCEQAGVRLVLVDNKFRSQRCFDCGFVHKSNRNSDQFCCGHCGVAGDADFNASKNIALDLPTIPDWVWRRKNSKGFFWNTDSIVPCG